MKAVATQSKQEPEKKSKDVFEEGISWETQREELLQQKASAGWNMAKLLVVLLLLVSATLVIVAMKKEAYPFVITLDKSNGQTEVIDITDPGNVPVNDMMDKYWLNNYVLSRETYDYRTVENDFIKTREMSLPEVFNPYADQFGNGKNSLETLLGDKKRILVDVISVVPNGNGIATVRFAKKLVDTNTGAEEAKNYWTATIGYDYFPSFKVEEKRRLINPLGFKVTSYRVDPELNLGDHS